MDIYDSMKGKELVELAKGRNLTYSGKRVGELKNMHREYDRLMNANNNANNDANNNANNTATNNANNNANNNGAGAFIINGGNNNNNVNNVAAGASNIIVGRGGKHFTVNAAMPSNIGGADAAGSWNMSTLEAVVNQLGDDPEERGLLHNEGEVQEDDAGPHPTANAPPTNNKDGEEASFEHVDDVNDNDDVAAKEAEAEEEEKKEEEEEKKEEEMIEEVDGPPTELLIHLPTSVPANNVVSASQTIVSYDNGLLGNDGGGADDDSATTDGQSTESEQSADLLDNP